MIIDFKNERLKIELCTVFNDTNHLPLESACNMTFRSFLLVNYHKRLLIEEFPELSKVLDISMEED